MVPEQRDRPPRRVADVRLRETTARLYWPAEPGTPAMLVQFGPFGGPWPDALVLATRVLDLEAALRVVEWAADHSVELGADPSRVLLAGEPGLLAAIQAAARDRGWPPVEIARPHTDEFRSARSS
jgi:hypothetical protein